MEVHYICHSTWVVAQDDLALLFDYSEKVLGPRTRTLTERALGGRKTVALFSHGHADHFDLKVSHLPGIALYLLPPDVAGTPLKPAIKVPLHGEVSLLKNIRLRTVPSTDEGVAFLIKGPRGGRVFFAGDLALWKWPEDTPDEQAEMERKWDEALRLVGRERIDTAFLVADPRLEHMGGFREALQRLLPRYTFPIHDFGTREHLKALEDLEGVIIPSTPGQRFTLDIEL